MIKSKLKQLTEEIIRKMTNPIYFERGENYQKQGMVIKGWITDTGIKAKVNGNYKTYYIVEIELDEQLKLRGNCTCPVSYGCKHCVAACLHYLAHPNYFLDLSSSNSNISIQKSLKIKKKLNIESKYKLETISIEKFIEFLTIEDLKSKFECLWKRFAPEKFETVIDPNYPYKYWEKNLIEIVDFEDFLINNKIQNQISNWFMPLELLTFLGKKINYISLLYNWGISYTKLGLFLEDIFKEIGINREDINFDPEFYFFGYNSRNDFWKSDYFDSIMIAEEYFSQFKQIFKEMGQFYRILIKENSTELPEKMYSYGLKWFLCLDLSEYEDYGFNVLYKIQKKVLRQFKIN